MKKIIILICLTLSTLVWSQQQIQVTLSLEKTVFFVSESIYLNILFINTVDEPIPTIYVTENLTIQDSNGKIYHSNIQFSSIGYPVLPRDTLNYTKELLSYYGNIWFKDENEVYGFPSGTYNLYIEYKGENVIVKSNKLIIRIVEPDGEEKEAFKLYTKMFYMFSHSKKFDNKKIFEPCEELLKNYPNSIYIPRVLMLVGIEERKRIGSFKYFEQLITNYPDNRISAGSIKSKALNFKYYNEKEKSEFRKIIETVIMKYPNSLVAEEAAKQLKDNTVY